MSKTWENMTDRERDVAVAQRVRRFSRVRVSCDPNTGDVAEWFETDGRVVEVQDYTHDRSLCIKEANRKNVLTRCAIRNALEKIVQRDGGDFALWGFATDMQWAEAMYRALARKRKTMK